MEIKIMSGNLHEIIDKDLRNLTEEQLKKMKKLFNNKNHEDKKGKGVGDFNGAFNDYIKMNDNERRKDFVDNILRKQKKKKQDTYQDQRSSADTVFGQYVNDVRAKDEKRKKDSKGKIISDYITNQINFRNYSQDAEKQPFYLLNLATLAIEANYISVDKVVHFIQKNMVENALPAGRKIPGKPFRTATLDSRAMDQDIMQLEKLCEVHKYDTKKAFENTYKSANRVYFTNLKKKTSNERAKQYDYNIAEIINDINIVKNKNTKTMHVDKNDYARYELYFEEALYKTTEARLEKSIQEKDKEGIEFQTQVAIYACQYLGVDRTKELEAKLKTQKRAAEAIGNTQKVEYLNIALDEIAHYKQAIPEPYKFVKKEETETRNVHVYTPQSKQATETTSKKKKRTPREYHPLHNFEKVSSHPVAPEQSLTVYKKN